MDRLVWLLRHFELRARVYHTGRVRRAASHPAEEGVGHLHLLRGGTVRLESNGAAPQLISEPSVLFYLNPVSHRITPAGAGADMVCAAVDFGIGDGNPLRLALPDVVVLPLCCSPELEATLNLLFAEAEASRCGRDAVLDRLSEVALIQILRSLMAREDVHIGLLAGLADNRLAKAISAMHADPARAWTLPALAAAAGMSRARFAARFRDTVGMTPGDYLAEWRLGLAQSLLRRGKPVGVVAEEVGYASPSALSRAFAARRGMSPTEWRRRAVA